jgi:aspartate carbamoyltransferase catalytic subunit
MSYSSIIRSDALTLPVLHALLKQASIYAAALKADELPGPAVSPLLQGKTVCTLFHENSTRTRLSFEQAAHHLGAHVLRFDVATSSLHKGESLEDTLDTLLAMGVHATVLRHGNDEIMPGLVKHLNGEMALLSAGEGMRDHPTQGLLDMLTLFQLAEGDFTRLASLKLLIVGDIKHSRVVGANLALAHVLGVSVTLVAPPMLQPSAAVLEEWRTRYGISDLHPALTNDLLESHDVVMALRLQRERLASGDAAPELVNAIVQEVQLTHERLTRLKNRTLHFMHPGPTNWGVELGHSLNDRHHPQSLIHTQVRNGVAMRMACLAYGFGMLPV